MRGVTEARRSLQGVLLPTPQPTERWPSVRDVPQGRYIAISAGWGHDCAIAESRELVCWGRNDFGQADPPAGRYTALAPGAWCALSEAGEIACWGWDEHEPREHRDAPPGRYSALGSGTLPCALDEAGDVVCWGRLLYAGNWPDQPEGPFESVSGANHHACAIRPGGEVTCWGVFDLADPPPGRYTAVSVGWTWFKGDRETSCGLTDAGAIVCWDYWTGSIHPEQGPYVALDISGRHGCAITELGELVCWGGIVAELVPPARESVRYTAVSVHHGSACALTDDGEVVCWTATPREDAPDLSAGNRALATCGSVLDRSNRNHELAGSGDRTW